MRQDCFAGRRGDVDCFDRTGQTAAGGSVHAQDINAAHQIGERARAEHIFTSGQRRRYLAMQLMSQPPVGGGERIFDKIQPELIKVATEALRFVSVFQVQ